MPVDPHTPRRRVKFDELMLVLHHDVTDILYLYKEAAMDRSSRTLPNDREITLEPTTNYNGNFSYKGYAPPTDTLLHR